MCTKKTSEVSHMLRVFFAVVFLQVFVNPAKRGICQDSPTCWAGESPPRSCSAEGKMRLCIVDRPWGNVGGH